MPLLELQLRTLNATMSCVATLCVVKSVVRQVMTFALGLVKSGRLHAAHGSAGQDEASCLQMGKTLDDWANV